MTDQTKIKPYGTNILVRMASPPVPENSFIIRPETSKESFAKGPEFKFSGEGVAARVLAVGSLVTDVAVGDLVLVDKLAGQPIDEFEGSSNERELRIIRDEGVAIVAVLESSP